MSTRRLSRRKLLRLGAALGAGGLAACLPNAPAPVDVEPQGTHTPVPEFAGISDQPTPQEPTAASEVALPTAAEATSTNVPPTATAEPLPPATPKVVHIYHSQVTRWVPGERIDYWNTLDQEAVNQMVDDGVMRLTGSSSVEEAWKALMPGYATGKKIAIKASFNNAFECNENESQGRINGVIQIVNAMVRGMKLFGLNEADVHVYDATRYLPDSFINGCLYSGVQFFDAGGCGQKHREAGFASPDPSSILNFDSRSGIGQDVVKLTDVLVNATYVINMPIMKIHSVGISLGFKNHFGSINQPGELHPTIDTTRPTYRSDYTPMIELYQNPHIGPKTILTVADGLFCSDMFTNAPVSWQTFGNAVPKSLFFSRDPVAIDCVMADFLRAEWPDKVKDVCYDYLRLAAEAGLGVFESTDPFVQGAYKQIQYERVDLA